jgi:hypothetical protein
MKSNANNHRNSQEIICQQVLADDQSVQSAQWTTIPAGLEPDLNSGQMLLRYLEYIRRCTGGLVRPHSGPDGIEFRLAGSTVTLIRFLPPEQLTTPAGDCTTLRICGGILVQPEECDRGMLDFMVERDPSGHTLSLRLSDYCPLLLGSPAPSFWRKWLYRMTQAYIHRVVTIRFLASMVRDIDGLPRRLRVTRLNQDGRENI